MEMDEVETARVTWVFGRPVLVALNDETPVGTARACVSHARWMSTVSDPLRDRST
jgi:hypothetical protein